MKLCDKGDILLAVAKATTWLLLVTTCVTCVPVAAAPSWKSPIDHSKERWLGDESYYDVFPEGPEQPQADGRRGVAADLCPPVPSLLPPGGCDVEECSSDRQCASQGLKCCYNGCTYTCLPEVKPAPYFDWYREPRRRFQSGQSWLIPGPNNLVNVETCSSSQPDDDSSPLLCPHGYECSIVKEGSKRKGIPNQGVCVRARKKHKHKKGHSGAAHHQAPRPSVVFHSDDVTSELVHGCDVGKGLKLIQGFTVLIDGKHCICQDTKLHCVS